MHACDFGKINDTHILYNKIFKPGIPGIFQNIPGYFIFTSKCKH